MDELLFTTQLKAIFLVISTLRYTNAGNECRNLKFPPDKENGFVLKNHVVEEHVLDNDSQCRIKCYLHNDCQSYNFGPSTVPKKYTCQVNDAVKHNNTKDFKGAAGFFYHEVLENPCRSNPCGILGTRSCQVGFGDEFRCACKQGLTGKLCKIDIDECAQSLHNCSDNAICNNTWGSFKCECPYGHNGGGYKPDKCTYIDECALGNYSCPSGVVCKDLPYPQTYTCDCPAGYELIGGKCEDINECNATNKPCDAYDGICTNTIGSYTCACKPGFTGSGEPGYCFGNGLTKNTPGSTSCLKIYQKFPNSADGVYWIDTTSKTHEDAFQVYCDMTTNPGGWTMVWSYEFMTWKSFKTNENCLITTPKGYNSHGFPSGSKWTDLNSPGAVPYDQWQHIGKAFLIKSNINNGIYCPYTHGGDISTKKSGVYSVCKIAKAVHHSCFQKPNYVKFDDCGVSIGVKNGENVNPIYRLETCDDKYWPMHDPCAQNSTNHITSNVAGRGHLFLK